MAGPDVVETRPPADEADLSPLEASAHNARRAKASLPPLVPEPRLMRAARAHARDMAARGRMSHTGRGGSQPHQRISRVGYDYASSGENVAYGQDDVGQVVGDWMSSRGHRRNILGDFEEIGVGVAEGRDGRRYWCVTFGRRRGGQGTRM